MEHTAGNGPIRDIIKSLRIHKSCTRVRIRWIIVLNESHSIYDYTSILGIGATISPQVFKAKYHLEKCVAHEYPKPDLFFLGKSDTTSNKKKEGRENEIRHSGLI